ncbi:hypothetical protein AB2T96_20465 [Clostridium butyricum]|uniref:Uncharacterized protein n=1 Tax=Clostridium butyricum TaxID=1492 RepID=A0A512TQW1_CLOBU|nr:hypothetical protein [Clostridium butyricum]NOW22105.1 hypothetical protein [Clostridium butyricum]GEQ22493.1 hypothetical protein CBU02nite_29990 [Clostridium butyricum]
MKKTEILERIHAREVKNAVFSIISVNGKVISDANKLRLNKSETGKGIGELYTYEIDSIGDIESSKEFMSGILGKYFNIKVEDGDPEVSHNNVITIEKCQMIEIENRIHDFRMIIYKFQYDVANRKDELIKEDTINEYSK